jgi:hypothetical protein
MPQPTTTARLETFETAYVGWNSRPLEVVTASAELLDLSQDLVSLQTTIGPRLHALHVAHVPEETDDPDRWAEAMTWLMLRHVRSLRRAVQRGRQQAATRALLDSTLRFKAAWDSYRAATNT